VIVTPTNKSVTELKGLHLYHADMVQLLYGVSTKPTSSIEHGILREARYLVHRAHHGFRR